MAQLNGLPVYFIKIDDSLDSNQGIDMVSLVDYPAIESNWVAMSNEKKFTFNADKQMLYGAILIPNQPIYRFSAEMGEYYVVFTEAEIIKLVRKFQAQQKTVNLNYQHKKDSQLSNAVIQEIWLTGKTDKSQDLGFNFPPNTAMVGAYIGDSKFWAEEVKSGNVRGFSIEGFLDMEMSKIKTKYKMEVKTTDGMIIMTDAETLAVGADVYFINEAGDQMPVADGDYMLDNAQTISVVAGKVTEIADTPTEETEEGLGEAETAIIQSAMKSQIDELKAELEAIKLSITNKPAAAPATQVTEPKTVETKMSAIERVKQLINNK